MKREKKDLYASERASVVLYGMELRRPGETNGCERAVCVCAVHRAVAAVALNPQSSLVSGADL